VAQGLRLRRLHEVHEGLALDPHALVEGLGDGGGDGVDALQRRREVLRDGADGVAGELEETFRVRVVDLQVAHALQRPLLLHRLFGEGQRAGLQVALDELVEERRALQLLGGNDGPGNDHVERRLRPEQARQALRAAGAGQDAELHFRQRDLRAGHGDAVVAAERQLEAAAHAGAADGGDDRLGGRLDDADHGVEVRFGQRLGRIELADIGAAGEGLGAADQHDGLYGRVGHRFVEAGDEAAAQLVAEAVDRRVVH
jgi:hypothetical protein